MAHLRTYYTVVICLGLSHHQATDQIYHWKKDKYFLKFRLVGFVNNSFTIAFIYTLTSWDKICTSKIDVLLSTMAIWRSIHNFNSFFFTINVVREYFKFIRKCYTYSPAPIDKLSGFPLIKYKFSPVQWKTLKLGLNLNNSDSPVP